MNKIEWREPLIGGEWTGDPRFTIHHSRVSYHLCLSGNPKSKHDLAQSQAMMYRDRKQKLWQLRLPYTTPHHTTPRHRVLIALTYLVSTLRPSIHIQPKFPATNPTNPVQQQPSNFETSRTRQTPRIAISTSQPTNTRYTQSKTISSHRRFENLAFKSPKPQPCSLPISVRIALNSGIASL
jgi:hypothetical protein